MKSCRKGGHPKTPENTYVNPSTGSSYGRPCAEISRRKSRGGAPRLIKPGRRPRGARVLTQREIDALRAAVACMGCGARRVGREGQPAEIHHKGGCQVRMNEIAEARTEALRARWGRKTNAA